MPFSISPGVNVSEIDLTTVVPGVATTEGAIAGVFRWGPTNERVLVSNEVELANTFGKPTNDNYETFFTAANFLSYSDALYVTRVTANAAVADANGAFEAAYEGELGNSLAVAYVTSASEFNGAASTYTIDVDASSTTGVVSGSDDDLNEIEVGDVLVVNNQELRITSIGSIANNAGTYSATVTFNTKYVAVEDAANTSFDVKWGWSSFFEAAPGTNELHIVVYDEDGEFTGEAGTVLETYSNLSTVAGTKFFDGTTAYVNDALTQRSAYIRRTSGTLAAKGYESFVGGDDGATESTIPVGTLAAGYDLYQTSDEVDVSLILQGYPREDAFANYLIDNIAEKRRDCVVFITPNVTPGSYTAQQLVTAVAGLSASSYAVVDSGFKYQYDKYNDVYRWVPLNGDVAGLCARTDDNRDPWYSPAGYNRGFIKNVVKLSLNPTKVERDLIYKNGINPVISQAGQGTLLFGDKTFLNQPSAFDRINVRRLFIVLEKAIAISARRSLFEFNDDFTRAQFRNLVEPFLRDVQGRRGITDFRVVCDGTNNTPEVIDRNEFIGDIYIKPARSINFIQLNFVAVRTGVEFSEIVGQAT
jgi:phage tail sheath protein FI